MLYSEATESGRGERGNAGAARSLNLSHRRERDGGNPLAWGLALPGARMPRSTVGPEGVDATRRARSM